MEITNLEFIAPTQATKVGYLSLGVRLPVVVDELPREFDDNEDANIELSTETVGLLNKLKASIISDLAKQTDHD